MRKLLALLLFAAACPSKAAPSREAYAIGTYLGGGSLLFGPSHCTYDAAPAVAELSTKDQGNKFLAKLVGAGTITETCGNQKTFYDVLAATAGRIEGPESWKIGATGDDGYQFIPLAGTRPLRGLHAGGESPEWSLGKDCAGVATFGVVLGAQDTGGRDITRKLVGTKAGRCTITATALGVSASKTVQIR